MEHKPIAIMILPVFVMGILMLGTVAAISTFNRAYAQESSNTGTYPGCEPPGPCEQARTASQADEKTILDIHNRERTAVGVPDLVWSESLAGDALAYLDKMVAQNQGAVFKPSPDFQMLRHDPNIPRNESTGLRLQG